MIPKWARLAVIAVFALIAVAWWLASRPDHLVSADELRAAAPRLLETYAHGKRAGNRACFNVDENKPFRFDSVCYFGAADHQTLMFTTDGIHYRTSRGVIYRADAQSPAPDGICTRHLFGRWSEFAPLDDPNCPAGFDHYTGEG